MILLNSVYWMIMFDNKCMVIKLKYREINPINTFN